MGKRKIVINLNDDTDSIYSDEAILRRAADVIRDLELKYNPEKTVTITFHDAKLKIGHMTQVGKSIGFMEKKGV